MPDLTWTREPPKVPGWYWWRPIGLDDVIRDIFKGIVLVHESEKSGATLVIDGRHDEIPVLDTQVPHEWAGPIPEPREVDPE